MHSEQLRIKLFRALDVGDPEHKVTQAFYGNHCNEPPSLTLNTAIILLGANPSINFGMGRAGQFTDAASRVALLGKILMAGSDLIHYIFKLD